MKRNGHAILASLLLLALLSVLAAAVLQSVVNKMTTIHQAAEWQEALCASESGVDLAVAALRASLSDPESAWNGWQTADANGNPYPNAGRRLEGASWAPGVSANVILEALPAHLDEFGAQWFRVRSLGTAKLSGPMRLPAKEDVRLRRLSFLHSSVSGLAVSEPEASRQVEVMLKPRRRFDRAVIAQDWIRINNGNPEIDSYDSSDPTKSSGGLYDPEKRGANGDLGTNGQLIEAGGAYIYGDVATHEGVVTRGENITGEIETDFDQELLPVPVPGWTSIIPNPNTVRKSMDLSGSAAASSPARYKLLSLSLQGSSNLVLRGSGTGELRYFQIWVVGDMKTTGQAQITLEPGVRVEFFVEGNVEIGGGGFVNSDCRPSSLTIHSVQPTSGAAPTVDIRGNSTFYGVIDAPTSEVTLSGGGTTLSDFYGSIIGKTVRFNGNVNLHYDEHLSRVGPVSDYQIASWFELTR